ncbi:hypothetical protein BaRGS_00025287 [Batillaria attramentaria]|uniref:SCP domain-containing protein n=1 Tax=Batillaria attramentaria TaxID=370345 RepID=A0ABD0K8U3_9CAEN
MQKVAFSACALLMLLGLAADAATVEEAAVKAHNDARRADAKAAGATNLYELVWDPALAKDAQNWAEKCAFEHSHPAGEGQNLYYRSPRHHPDDYYINLAVQKWMAEKQDDTSGHFDCCASGSNHHSCCHYTQVVSARSRKVGCHVAHCDHLTRDGNTITTNSPAYVVCNYEPAGNHFSHGSHAAYLTGQLCSACDTGDKCNDGLCVTSTETVWTKQISIGDKGEVISGSLSCSDFHFTHPVQFPLQVRLLFSPLGQQGFYCL